MDFSDLDGQSCLITGAGAGMGRACAILFGKAGCKLALADRDEKALQATIAELNLPKESVYSMTLDITDDKAVEGFVASVAETYGRLDIALNCAGVLGKTGNIHELTMDDYDFVMNINARAAVLLARLQIAQMLEQESLPGRGRGAIVNWASWIAFHATAVSPNYGISKWAVMSLTVTYAKQGIRVNGVAPGFVNTPFQQDPQMAASQAKIPAIVPQQRAGEPEEVAKVALFLASAAASYVNGHTISVDGGWNAS